MTAISRREYKDSGPFDSSPLNQVISLIMWFIIQTLCWVRRIHMEIHGPTCLSTEVRLQLAVYCCLLYCFLLCLLYGRCLSVMELIRYIFAQVMFKSSLSLFFQECPDNAWESSMVCFPSLKR